MIRVFKSLGLKNWLLMLVCAVFIVTQVWLDLKLPDYMSDITKLVETDGSKMHDVLTAGCKMLAVSGGSMLCAIVSSLIAAVISAQVAKRLRAKQFHQVESYGPEEVDKFSTPSLVTRATNDVTQVQMFLTMGLVLIVRAPVMAVWAIFKIAGKGIEWTEATGLALGLLLLMVGVLLVTCLPKFKAMQMLTDDVNRVARENLTGIRTIRAYNAEDYQQRRFSDANDALTNTQLFTSRVTASIMPFMTLVLNGLSLAIYWIGAFLLNKPKFDTVCSKPDIPDVYMQAMQNKDLIPQLAMSGQIDPSKLQDYGAQMKTYASCMKTGASALKMTMESRVDVFSNMIVFSSYAMQVIMAFLLCAMLFVLLPRAQASAKRIWEVIDTEPKIKDGSMAIEASASSSLSADVKTATAAIEVKNDSTDSSVSSKTVDRPNPFEDRRENNANTSAVGDDSMNESEQRGEETAASITKTKRSTGNIEFRNVSYTYPGKSQPDLKGISFKIADGQTLGVIGSTGSGKSTLASLIPRLRDSDYGGEVIIDGKNVKDLNQKDLRKRIGYVTQKAIMLKGTVRDNIDLGVDLESERAVGVDSKMLDRWAANVAQASEFIDSKPEGMGYMISQGGSNLSGGQKQRVNIARAVRIRPEILILDDSTSALDMRTDAKLREALGKELAGTTIVMIAQRVSSLMNADKILVLDEGMAVGYGTHDELMKTCEEYREIAEGQLGKEAWSNGRN